MIPRIHFVHIGAERKVFNHLRWKRVMAETGERAVELVLKHHSKAVPRLARRRSETKVWVVPQLVGEPGDRPRMPCVMHSFALRFR